MLEVSLQTKIFNVRFRGGIDSAVVVGAVVGAAVVGAAVVTTGCCAVQPTSARRQVRISVNAVSFFMIEPPFVLGRCSLTF
jgi:hypothetical protein